MKIGIASHTYKWSFGVSGYPQPLRRMDGEALILKASSLGVNLVQFGDNYPLHLRTERELLDWKALAAEKGIELEVGTLGTAPESLLNYLQIARLLDARLVRTRIGTKERMENLQEAERGLRGVVGEFERQGILLVLENYESYPVRQLADLIRRIGSPALGACLDTGNSVAALESPDVVAEALAPIARCLHIKDFRFIRADHGLGYRVEGCPVGEGMVDAERILAAVLPHGKLVSVVLEQWTPYQASLEATLAVQDSWVKKSLHRIAELLG